MSAVSACGSTSSTVKVESVNRLRSRAVPDSAGGVDRMAIGVSDDENAGDIQTFPDTWIVRGALLSRSRWRDAQEPSNWKSSACLSIEPSGKMMLFRDGTRFRRECHHAILRVSLAIRQPSSPQNILQPVIPFVAGVLVDLFVAEVHRQSSG